MPFNAKTKIPLTIWVPTAREVETLRKWIDLYGDPQEERIRYFRTHQRTQAKED